jgi:hypothetical protein
MTKDTEYEIMASLEERLHAISGTIDGALAWESGLLLKLEKRIDHSARFIRLMDEGPVNSIRTETHGICEPEDTDMCEDLLHISSPVTTPDHSSKKDQPYKKYLMRQIISLREEKLRAILEGMKEKIEDRAKQTIGTKVPSCPPPEAASYDQIQACETVGGFL